MIKRPLRNLTAAAILAGATHGAIAQTPMPQTPTTKILAVGTFAPGTDMSQVQRILPTEVRETAQLYLDGKIDHWLACHCRFISWPLARRHWPTLDARRTFRRSPGVDRRLSFLRENGSGIAQSRRERCNVPHEQHKVLRSDLGWPRQRGQDQR